MNNLKKSKRNKTAVIYTRVSTDDQAVKGYSLLDQEEVLRRACKADGVEVIDHIQDDGYSAKTFNRPAFQQLLTRLKNGQLVVDFLYVVRWDRFSRNMENRFLMLRDLRSYGRQT
jgi:site-specific DNA recombinase